MTLARIVIRSSLMNPLNIGMVGDGVKFSGGRLIGGGVGGRLVEFGFEGGGCEDVLEFLFAD